MLFFHADIMSLSTGLPARISYIKELKTVWLFIKKHFSHCSLMLALNYLPFDQKKLRAKIWFLSNEKSELIPGC